MTQSDTCSLPLRKIEAALRKTTELLATELAVPSAVAPDWTDFEWCIAQAVAAIHGVSPLLTTALRWRGPEEWACFLRCQTEHTLRRQQRISQLLASIDSQARRVRIPIVALKGAALHAIGIYRAGERPMADIDLLVRKADEATAARLLQTLGYHESFTYWRNSTFIPVVGKSTQGFGEHAGNPIKIELHTRIVERLPVAETEISRHVFPSAAPQGLNSYPSVGSLMMHLLLHAAGNMCNRGLRLIQLHDIALLAAHMTPRDWEIVMPVGDEPSRWVWPPLALLSIYYPRLLPSQVVARAEADCLRLLRWAAHRQRLSDVSFSDLRIEAFPGIEWSCSTIEMLKYIGRRVRPDADMLAARREVASTHPGADQTIWSRLPQWQRMLRWTVSRPPRMETLFSVRAALAPVTRRQ